MYRNVPQFPPISAVPFFCQSGAEWVLGRNELDSSSTWPLRIDQSYQYVPLSGLHIYQNFLLGGGENYSLYLFFNTDLYSIVRSLIAVSIALCCLFFCSRVAEIWQLYKGHFRLCSIS
jgi:hypothetical protein